MSALLAHTTVQRRQNVQTLMAASHVLVGPVTLEMDRIVMVRGDQSNIQQLDIISLFISTDIDECMESPCMGIVPCRNTQGGYECVCESGYEWNGSECQGTLRSAEWGKNY